MLSHPDDLSPVNLNRPRRARGRFSPAFTLIELLVVIAIIALLAGISLPAIKSLTKSNDQSQSTNLVRSMISNARSIAIAQHRMVGVVFFEETAAYSLPVNSGQTAMQLFVEDYNQAQYGAGAGITVFVRYSSMRQYLPSGVKLAALTDSPTSVELADNSISTPVARAILFDANGELCLRGGLICIPPGAGTAGTYPRAYGDWNFTGASSQSSPGFFLYNKAEYDAQPTGAGRITWLKKNATVVIVNANTGGVLR